MHGKVDPSITSLKKTIIYYIGVVRCSASFMVAIDNGKSCKCLIRRAIFSIRTRTYAAVNNIIQCNNIVQSDTLRQQFDVSGI